MVNGKCIVISSSVKSQSDVMNIADFVVHCQQMLFDKIMSEEKQT